jgi:hypothetical protein
VPGVDAICFKFDYINGVCVLITESTFFEKLPSLRTKFIFNLFEKRFLLTKDLSIKYYDLKFHLTVSGRLFYEIEPNSSSNPFTIILESICKLHIKL